MAPAYKSIIDDKITNELFENKELGWLDIKRRVEKSLNIESMPKDTFSLHMRRLVDTHVSNRVDKGRGKKVYHSLTTEARREKYLGILGNGPEDELLRRIYAKIFFFTIIETKSYKTEDLDVLLSKIGISKKDLSVEITLNSEGIGTWIPSFFPTRNTYDWILLSLRPGPSTPNLQEILSLLDSIKNRPVQKQRLPSYDKNFDRHIGIDTGDLLDTATLVNGFPGSAIKKTKYKPINGITITETIYRFVENISPRKLLIQYACYLPGTSISELLAKDFNGTKLKRQEVENALELLRVDNLIRYITHFAGEDRYVIADDELTGLVLDLRYIHGLEQNVFAIEFYYCREPIDEERNRLELFYGKKAAARIFKEAKVARFELRDLVAKFYSNNRDDVRRILDECVDNARRELNHGIKSVIEKHSKTIQEYKFLHEVIKIVCPMIE